ncbi:MAG: MtnX-like HAD-IB family phosphatase [Candidatus Omnitrophota bacterium]
MTQVKGILVSDFDGTITQYDFYDLVCQAFPEISGGYWQQYESGKITHFEALRLIFAGIRASEERLLEIIASMQICSRIRPCVDALRQTGWDVLVASAGCDWYIKRLLAKEGVMLTVYANPGVFLPQQGLVMQLPEPSPFFSAELGVNKVAVVREAIKVSSCVAFAGDGRPDLAAALLVPPERRFAKSWLAKKLHEIGEGFRPFDHWNEVGEALIRENIL